MAGTCFSAVGTQAPDLVRVLVPTAPLTLQNPDLAAACLRDEIDLCADPAWGAEALCMQVLAARSLAQQRREQRRALSRLRKLEVATRELEDTISERAHRLQSATRRLQEKQQELVRMETKNAVAQVVRGLAHELNNPLAAILGYAQRLQRTLRDDGETVKRLEVIVGEVERCRTLVEQLRRLAAPLDEALTPCQFGSILKQAVQRRLDAGHALPHVKVIGEIPPVLGAHRTLVRIVEQVLENAALHGATTCLLSCEDRDGRLRIRLDNDGSTPSDDVVAGAVKPFFTTLADSGHRGLGLAIAHSLLREQGGLISLEKRADGPGASVLIQLPQATASGLQRSATAVATHLAATVLVIDDEPLIAELLHDCLRDVGCQAIAVASCEAAEEHLRTGTVRAALADVHLPDGSGVDLLRRALAAHPELSGHLALVTGATDSHDIERMRRETGWPVLSKPFRLEQVHALLLLIL